MSQKHPIDFGCFFFLKKKESEWYTGFSYRKIFKYKVHNNHVILSYK